MRKDNKESSPEIKHFEKFFNSLLNGEKVLDFSTKYLTTLGDNYGSTMLAVSVRIQNEKNDEFEPEILELVAKMPPTKKQLWDMYEIEISFVKENKMYTEIFPTLLEFQRDIVTENEIIDFLPFCYGTRISLDKDVVDLDGILLLENLEVKGYRVGDRTKGFDDEHILIILKNLAYFHAIPIALKFLKPKVFEKIIRKNVIRIGSLMEVLDFETRKKRMKSFHKDFNNIKELEHLQYRIKNHLKKYNNLQNKLEDSNSPYSTIVHNDFWVNNMMISYDEEGHPNAVKIIDFQLMMIESLVHDLIFFLFSSVEQDMLDEKMDEYIKYYYDSFYNCLKELGCPLNDFTYEKFLAEISRKAPYELFHILIMLRVFFAKKEAIPDLDNYDNDFFIKEDLVGSEYYEKFKNIVQEFERRNWLL